jgi:hypothetical protein
MRKYSESLKDKLVTSNKGNQYKFWNVFMITDRII